MMLLTVASPTRHRPKELWRMVESVFASIEEKDAVEVVVRAYEDDEETIKLLPELAKLGNMRSVIRKNLGWHGNDNAYLAEMYETALGDWVLGFNDDAIISEGYYGWEQQLRRFPLTKAYLEPSSYLVNGEACSSRGTDPFKLFPRTWMQQLKLLEYGVPYDSNIWANNMLTRHDWQPHQIHLGIDHIQIKDQLRIEEDRLDGY